jgi:hypothetical protein
LSIAEAASIVDLMSVVEMIPRRMIEEIFQKNFSVFASGFNQQLELCVDTSEKYRIV